MSILGSLAARTAEFSIRAQPHIERAYSGAALRRIGQHGRHCEIGLHSRVSFGEHMIFGDRVRVGPFSRLGTVPRHFEQHLAPTLVLEDGVSTEWFTHIACADSIIIEQETMIAGRVFITDHDHGFRDPAVLDVAPAFRPLETAPVRIGARCWLGEGVCVLRGVTIGAGTIVGAGSVVIHDLPANCVAAGAPARVIKTRGPDDRWHPV